MAGFADIELDTHVLSLLKSGDVGAVGLIYERSAAVVHGMALRILQDSGLAQEVVQDTFVELIENVGNLRKPLAVVGWLRRVAVTCWGFCWPTLVTLKGSDSRGLHRVPGPMKQVCAPVIS
ncbi:MAG: sigma factor [Proteobacteria bacterium]|nr:sigma factor [Pseudomonadota bacterium]